MFSGDIIYREQTVHGSCTCYCVTVVLLYSLALMAVVHVTVVLLYSLALMAVVHVTVVLLYSLALMEVVHVTV